MSTVKCVTCGKQFQAKRSTAKYCSDVCRVTFSTHGSNMRRSYLDAKYGIRQIIGLLKQDEDKWGHEAHTYAMELHEELSRLFAHTDFLGQSQLQDNRWKK